MSARSRFILPAFPCAALLVALSACAAPEQRGPWMLRWRVDLTERVDGGALGAIALPPSMAGVEV
ncbi:MAG: hypothetical protein L0Z55_02070, partial [Planctomycetes bacterium]|nr:hypothetical protein [Planctomycetota bacterium]